jgi:putative ABC transport system permease protein
MLKAHLKIALRGILRQKSYTFINVTGLAVAMACCIVIFLWIKDEWSFDRFHEKADDIYRVVETWQYSSGVADYNQVTPGPLAAVLKNDYPEIIDSTRYWGAYEKWQVTYDEKSFLSAGAAVDPSFFSMFTFPFIGGNMETAFPHPHSVVVTQRLAEKLFDLDDPIGKTIRIENRDFEVSSVIENPPLHSHLKFDFLFPCKVFPFLEQGWGNNMCYTYVLLQEGSSYKELSGKISGVIKEHNPTSIETLYLQPLAKIHLYSLGGGGLIIYMYIFSVLGIFTLLLACINFMNLSTARSSKRFKEVGMKKVMGADRWQLVKQFLSEYILLSLGALTLAIILVELFLPLFNRVLGRQIEMCYSGSLFLSLLGIAILTGIISGSYPAFFLSGFNPVFVLKGNFSSGSRGLLRGQTLRRILVVMQFSLSIFFLVCTMVVYKQLNFIQKADLGFERDHIIHMRMRGEFKQKYDAIKHELLQNPSIINVTATDRTPIMWSNSTDEVDWEGKGGEEKIGFGVRMVDYDYMDTFQMEMAQGRFFSKEFPADASQGFVVNESAVKAMGMKSPLGKSFSVWERKGKIIGVIKDFHTESLYKTISPFVLMIWPEWYGRMSIRIKSENIPATLGYIESKIKEFVPDYPFEYQFLDEELDSLYRTEQLTSKIIGYITILAVFISCLGLFGLSSFTTEQRTKEIGIRKVLGASVSGVVLLLNKEFTKWVIIANIIAWPVAYFAMRKWLQNFAYRADIGLGVFIFSAVLVLIVALMTVSYQSFKAAVAHPADSLKYE